MHLRSKYLFDIIHVMLTTALKTTLQCMSLIIPLFKHSTDEEEVEQAGSTPKGNSDEKSVTTLKEKKGGSTLNRSSNNRNDGSTLKSSSDGTPTLQPMSKSRKNKDATFR